jgi:hypothetical protein
MGVDVAVAVVVAVVVLFLVVVARREAYSPRKKTAPVQSAPAMGGKDACTWALSNYAYDNMHLMKTVGQRDSRMLKACEGRRPASMIRLPDVNGKRVLRLAGARPDGTPFEVQCANREECLVGWAKGVGRFWDKQSLSASKGQRAPWIFTDKQRFVVVTKDIPDRCKNVVNTLLKTKGPGPYIFVKPLVLVRGMMKWEDVNRVYAITKEPARGREYDRFVQAGGKPENWFAYSGNLQLVQLLYMQGLMARAGRVFMRVFERLPPSPQVARIASAIRKTFADPGAVYASGGTGQDAGANAGWQGVGNVHGVAMKLRGSRKDMDDADFAGLYLGGAAVAKPLMVTVIHEFAHHIDFAANDEFIGGHNYGFWSLLRFFELTMVAAGMITYDWRTNAKNYDAVGYGGFDPYYQRDWQRIEVEVRAKGGTKEDLARKGGAVGADKGSYEKTVWDDVWADVSNTDRNADKIVMQRFKALLKGLSTA